MSRSPLPALVFLLLAGFLAGAQLGKIAPLTDWYRTQFAMSLPEVGWIASAIGLFVAVAALPASLAIDRFGRFRAFVAGSALLSLGALLLPAASSMPWITLARGVEGLGYLLLVIVIPALLNSVAPPNLRAPALAIWGGFVPIGFALSDFLAAALLPDGNAASFLLVIGLGFAALAAAAAAMLLPIDTEPEAVSVEGSGIRANLSLPVLLVSAAFGIYVVQSLAFFAFLPAAAARNGGFLLSAGAISLTVPLGNIGASLLMRGRGARMAAALAAAGFVVGGIAALPAYGPAAPLISTAAAVAVAVSGGMVASALFASVPFIVPAGGSSAVVIGLICQAGGITTLIGPPIGGAVIESAGWGGFGVLLAGLSVAGCLAIMPLLRGR